MGISTGSPQAIKLTRFGSQESGFSIVDFLVGSTIATAFLVGVLQLYSQMVRYSFDHKIRIATVLQAQAILQTIGSEIRILGNGVPFDQPRFEIGDEELSNPVVSEPIIVATTTTSHIEFRLNETGDMLVLTQDFDTTQSGLTLHLTDVSSLEANDPIYISNSVVAEHDGLYGIIESVDPSTDTVVLEAGYVASPNALFATGSMVEEVPLVIYNSPNDGSGITRDSGFGPVLLGTNSTMSLDYYDEAGNQLTLPLTNQVVRDSLRAIKVRVQKTSDKQLSSGQVYTAQIEQVYGIRNLRLVY